MAHTNVFKIIFKKKWLRMLVSINLLLALSCDNSSCTPVRYPQLPIHRIVHKIQTRNAAHGNIVRAPRSANAELPGSVIQRRIADSEFKHTWSITKSSFMVTLQLTDNLTRWSICRKDRIFMIGLPDDDGQFRFIFKGHFGLRLGRRPFSCTIDVNRNDPHYFRIYESPLTQNLVIQHVLSGQYLVASPGNQQPTFTDQEELASGWEFS